MTRYESNNYSRQNNKWNMICLLLCTYELNRIIITTDVLREQRRMRVRRWGRHGRYFLLSFTVWSFTALFFKQEKVSSRASPAAMSSYSLDYRIMCLCSIWLHQTRLRTHVIYSMILFCFLLKIKNAFRSTVYETVVIP